MSEDELLLQKIVKIIVDTVNPSKIFLFGSRAKGTENKYSDYDFLIIKSNVQNERSISRMIYRELYQRKINAPIDLIVTDTSKFEKNKNNPLYIYKKAFDEGRILYG